MPFTTASCAGPGGRCSRFQASGSVAACSCCRGGSAVLTCALIGELLPIQGAFAPLVNETDRQDGEEGDHGEEAEPPHVAKCDRPGEQEGDLQVEDDEQDGH